MFKKTHTHKSTNKTTTTTKEPQFIQIIKGKHMAIDTKITPVLLPKKVIPFFFPKA